jgi:hypothetical protein
MDSGHFIGNGDGLIARKNRKLVKLSDANLLEWYKISSTIMKDATFAKFGHALQQNHEIVDILLATRNAKLLHLQLQRGKTSKLIHFKHLEDVRNHINFLMLS